MTYPARIFLFLCGLCLVFALWTGGRSIIDNGRRVHADAQLKPIQTARPSSSQNRSQTVEHRDVRPILPGKGSGPVVSSDMERLPPRPPLDESPAGRSPAGKPPEGRSRDEQSNAARPGKPAAPNADMKASAPPADPNERRQTILYHPIADAAGLIEAAKHRITLAGIEAVGKDETCPKAEGGTWRCGLVARTAFRAWLRGRAVTCDVPAVPGAITSSCTVGGDDLALWLVENGWAKSDDPHYRDAAGKAKDQKRGMFGDAPKAYSAMAALPALESLPPVDDDPSGQ